VVIDGEYVASTANVEIPFAMPASTRASIKALWAPRCLNAGTTVPSPSSAKKQDQPSLPTIEAHTPHLEEKKHVVHLGPPPPHAEHRWCAGRL